MHAFLTTDIPNIPDHPDTLKILPDTSIGIDQIHHLQTFLSRKPLAQHHTVIIVSAHLLTLPAQNALLKTLEDPPGGTQIYLVTTQPNLLLPTIRSRAHQLPSHSSPAKPSPLLTNLRAQDLGHRLLILDKLELDRPKALELIDQLEAAIHTDLSLSSSYRVLSATRAYLKANINLKLALDYMAIHL